MVTSPLKDEIADYLDHVAATQSPRTRYQYAFVLESVFLPWAIGHGVSDAQEMNDKALEAFTAFLRGRAKPLSVATVRSYLRQLWSFLKWAEVPKGRFKAPRQPKKMVEVLSREQIDRLEQTAADARDKLIVRTLADSGIRVGELLGLRPSDLRTVGNNHYLRVTGKNKARDVPVPGHLFRRLKNYSDMNGTDYIFMSKRRGQVLTPNGVNQLLHNLQELAGIKTRTYAHGFRHAFITHCARQRVPMDYVRMAVGHEDINLIAEVYQHMAAEDIHDVVVRAFQK
jgi:integrase/recombinase XerD